MRIVFDDFERAFKAMIMTAIVSGCIGLMLIVYLFSVLAALIVGSN